MAKPSVGCGSQPGNAERKEGLKCIKPTVPIFKFVNFGANLLFINYSDLSAEPHGFFGLFGYTNLIFRAFGRYLGYRIPDWDCMGRLGPKCDRTFPNLSSAAEKHLRQFGRSHKRFSFPICNRNI
jgi:hypothetical protein